MSEEPTVLLQPVGIVHTPKDLEELESYINLAFCCPQWGNIN
jgi:hypothetical protein